LDEFGFWRFEFGQREHCPRLIHAGDVKTGSFGHCCEYSAAATQINEYSTPNACTTKNFQDLRSR